VDNIKGLCRLCGDLRELQLSHVVPAFVFKWLKKDGFIRHAENIDRRVQDGAKAYWLCLECEERLNKWETEFSKKLFHPINSDSSHVASYGDWLLKFCVSISWRTLLYITTDHHLNHFTESQKGEATKALDVWRRFLLGELPNPGKHEQHLLPLDIIKSTAFNLPPNINRYLTRAVELDVGCSASSAFVFSKLGRFAIFGFINVLKPRSWEGTKVGVRGGTIRPRQYVLPSQVGKYLSDRAQRAWTSMRGLSETEQHKIDKHIMANPDKFIHSDLYRAMEQDIELFGADAFSRKK
jgi:hypothetical protein